MRMELSLLVLAAAQMSAVLGARILAVEPIGSRSHWQYMRSILDVLTARHQVTVITPLPTGDRENYTEIDASHVFPIYAEENAERMIEQFGSLIKMLPPMPERSHERDMCDAFFDHEPVKRLMRAENAGRYDVVVLEPFYSPCLSYLAHRLRVPEIYAIPSSMITPMEMLIFGTEPSPSYVPNLLYNGPVMDGFAQRLTNVAVHVYVKVVPWLTNVRMMYSEPKRYDVADVRHKPALVFINTHFITESPRPFPVNMIQIGGIHLKPRENLPEDILDFIEKSPHGVIYFTFGSVSSMSTLPNRIQQILIESFAQVPQRILWKYDGEIKNLSDNVMTRKWFPQRDVLLHPNVKLFISHGGISGVYEAVDAGVPVLGFPLFYDQPRNVGNLVNAEMALSLDLLTFNKNEFLKTIDKLINDKNYTKNAKVAAKRFKDRPMTPQDLVLYWTEYVIRHNGAQHLKSEALNLSWYQYILLDVIFVVIISFLVLVYLSYIVFNFIYLRFKMYSNVKIKSE
ncbi:UDP-glucuronosyltransferase 2B15-like [Sipha flava]|uniref:UDP-glucuronosyltransferase n=1 Tax=Sipha flava TaxID=143950 RepID=A0A2S2QLF1_9HEMI|nr:UDP-glucuronosyltransferase 2B15-like [Sipha flava]XP_025420631.1 UDP-glucuronosyltransferase 2B15-like [Sipha flava]XP_025420632.1 UDP-glucuronosyltransferase 2B15-like [Sipha flava]XP_025420633.1 UDP-glucuronosyltransferase 2B15-like [Sipha flava]